MHSIKSYIVLVSLWLAGDPGDRGLFTEALGQILPGSLAGRIGEEGEERLVALRASVLLSVKLLLGDVPGLFQFHSKKCKKKGRREERSPSPAADRHRCCVICQDKMDVPASIVTLQCMHCFHGQCIVTHLREDPRCPVCRDEPGATHNLSDEDDMGEEMETETLAERDGFGGQAVQLRNGFLEWFVPPPFSPRRTETEPPMQRHGTSGVGSTTGAEDVAGVGNLD